MNEFTVGLLAILAFGVALYGYAYFFLVRDRNRADHREHKR